MKIGGISIILKKKHTSLCTPSTTLTDKDCSLIGIYLVHPERNNMKWDMFCSYNMASIKFTEATNIDDLDFIGCRFDKLDKFFWYNGWKHNNRQELLTHGILERVEKLHDALIGNMIVDMLTILSSLYKTIFTHFCEKLR